MKSSFFSDVPGLISTAGEDIRLQIQQKQVTVAARPEEPNSKAVHFDNHQPVSFHKLNILRLAYEIIMNTTINVIPNLI